MKLDNKTFLQLKKLKNSEFLEKVISPYISDTTNTLREHYQKFLERALTYLFLGNTGGALAIVYAKEIEK